MTRFLAIILIINSYIAVGFGIFYVGTKICNELGISPWWSAAVFVIGYFWCLYVWSIAPETASEEQQHGR